MVSRPFFRPRCIRRYDMVPALRGSNPASYRPNPERASVITAATVRARMTPSPSHEARTPPSLTTGQGMGGAFTAAAAMREAVCFKQVPKVRIVEESPHRRAENRKYRSTHAADDERARPSSRNEAVLWNALPLHGAKSVSCEAKRGRLNSGVRTVPEGNGGSSSPRGG